MSAGTRSQGRRPALSEWHRELGPFRYPPPQPDRPELEPFQPAFLDLDPGEQAGREA